MNTGHDINHLSVCSKIAGPVFAVSLLTGCVTSPAHIPVLDLTVNNSTDLYRHEVQKGESLYAIAAQYGLSFHELATNNNISAPYIIQPGQYLYFGSQQPKPPKAEELALKNRSVKEKLHRDTDPKITTTKVTEQLPKKTVFSTSHQSSTVVESALNKKQTVSISQPPNRLVDDITWQWPASGGLISDFSIETDRHRGIAIGGDIGESVVATASGKVIYSGVGLAEYGKLIIIRHDSRYLSAYAHNQSLLVNEGEMVKAGQQIAELGSTGTNEPKLHFEIRQNGKPVDPLLFLPNR